MTEVVTKTLPPDVADAAEYVSAAWRQGVSAIIDTGRRLIEVRRRFDNQPGIWSRIIGANQWDGRSLLPFGRTHAQRLVRIAEAEHLYPHVGILPSDTLTLFEIARLPAERFHELVTNGKLRPDMRRHEIVAEIEAEARPPLEDGCTVADLNELIRAGKKFSVIYADPPWSFKVYSGKGKARSADRHYDTKSLDDIKALPVEALAADDCALLLWAVCPELPGALEVIKAWGFTYKTVAFSWVKENRSGDGLKWGMGYWTRANLEPCLLATRGSPKRQAMNVFQVVQSPIAEHSRKPDEVQVRIERLLNGPYLELYARRATPGWTVWGNEVSRNLFHRSIPEFAA